jgi:hypothetical protein
MVGPARADQALLEESAQKLVEQMTALSGSNALVSPQIAVALAVARRQMGLARDAVSSASPNLREAAERAGEAVDALNVATYGMVRARDDVSGSSSGSGLAEAMERMTRMAQSQGQLSQQGGQLLPMAGTPSLQMQLQALAAQQRALAQQLERMRAEGQIPGAKEMGEEARELARALEAGRLDRETVARQEQLFRRMLDAGRILEGEERDERKERQSTLPGMRRPPPTAREGLGGPALPMPSWSRSSGLPEARGWHDYFVDSRPVARRHRMVRLRGLPLMLARPRGTQPEPSARSNSSGAGTTPLLPRPIDGSWSEPADANVLLGLERVLTELGRAGEMAGAASDALAPSRLIRAVWPGGAGMDGRGGPRQRVARRALGRSSRAAGALA